ncbi:MAG: hypothetical protein MSA49_01295 [Clostridia bacterium]|nr:hypothetical protein [Clostridia bacterium]
MNPGLVFEIVVAFFAVIGIVMLVMALWERLTNRGNIVTAILIEKEEDLNKLDALWEMAHYTAGGRRIMLLLAEPYADNAELMEWIHAMGICCYVIAEEDEPGNQAD